MAVPVLKDIVRQHAEQAAFLWTLYDEEMLNPDEETETEHMDRLIEQLEAHLDGLRVAGAEGVAIAEERYADFPEAGELFVLRMLQPEAHDLRILDLELPKVREFIHSKLPKDESA